MYKIAKLFSINNVAVLKPVGKEAVLADGVVTHAERKIVMMDKMWLAIKGKKENLDLATY